MLKIITSAASGLIVAGGIGYGYVQKAQEHLATLERDNKVLTLQVTREDTAIDKAIAELRAARSHPAAAAAVTGDGAP
jgi:hypothetical protein